MKVMSVNVKKDDDSGSERASLSDDDKGAAGRKRTIDESHLEPDEVKKLESRRAYNRQCAAKARKRSKELVEHLQDQVEELTKDKAELKRGNELMRAQLELLEQQNRTLMMNQLANQGMNAGLAYGGGQGMGMGMGGGGAGPMNMGNNGMGMGMGGQFNGMGGGGGAGGAGTMAGNMNGQGAGTGAAGGGGMTLLDRLAMERASTQNQLQRLQGMNNGTNSGTSTAMNGESGRGF